MERSSLTWPCHIDLGQQQVAVVPVALLRAEHGGRFPWPPLVLPAVEAAGHADDVRVPELSQRLSGENAPDPAGAVNDDWGVGVGDLPRQLQLEVATRDVEGVPQRALLELVRLAHVERHGAAGLQYFSGLGGQHFGHARAGAVQELTKTCHTS